jgi:hypothetical protein
MLKTLVRNPKISKSKLVISNVGALVILLMFLLPEVKGWLVRRHLQSAKSAIAHGDYSGAKLEYDAAISTAEWFSSRSEEEGVYDDAFGSFKTAGRPDNAAAVIRSRVKDRERHYLNDFEGRSYLIIEINRSGTALSSLGPAYYAEARGLYEKALNLKEGWYGGWRDDSVELADGLDLISHTYELEHNYPKLLETRRRQLAILEKVSGSGDSKVRTLRASNAALLEKLGGECGLAKGVYFMDFKFPAIDPSHGKLVASGLTLSDGKYQFLDTGYLDLRKVEWADVTGDGQDDAFLTLDIHGNGMAVNGPLVYIFEIQKGVPTFLWSVEEEHQPITLLRDVYVKDGELVIERYIPIDAAKYRPSSDESSEELSLTSFTETRYIWRNNHFISKGKPETKAFAPGDIRTESAIVTDMVPN